jgi:hypothetical protein
MTHERETSQFEEHMIFFVVFLLVELWLLEALQQTSSRMKQTLTIVDQKTGVDVILVGCMHYNPHSINTVRDLLNDELSKDHLEGVLIESCPERWKRTQELDGTLSKILSNEMTSAAQIAESNNKLLILGDQDISITNRRMKETLQQSFIDLLSPWSGGWKRLYEDFSNGYSEAINPSSSNADTYLGLRDFFDAKLLLSLPSSLIKYPLATIVKSPVIGTIIVGTIALSAAAAGDDGFVGTTFAERIAEVSSGALGSLLEIALLARSFTTALLQERNIVLTKNIQTACVNIKKTTRGKKKKTLVAVLGMAHLNGIAKIMSAREE